MERMCTSCGLRGEPFINTIGTLSLLLDRPKLDASSQNCLQFVFKTPSDEFNVDVEASNTTIPSPPGLVGGGLVGEIADASTGTIVWHDNVDNSLQTTAFDDTDEQASVTAINWIDLLSSRADTRAQWDEISTDGLFDDNSVGFRLSQLSVNSGCGSVWSWPTPLVTPRGELDGSVSSLWSVPTNLDWAVETAGAMHWAAKSIKRVINLWRADASSAIQAQAAMHHWRVWSLGAVNTNVNRKNHILGVTHWTTHSIRTMIQRWRYIAQDSHAIQLPVAHTLVQLGHQQHRIIQREVLRRDKQSSEHIRDTTAQLVDGSTLPIQTNNSYAKNFEMAKLPIRIDLLLQNAFFTVQAADDCVLRAHSRGLKFRDSMNVKLQRT